MNGFESHAESNTQTIAYSDSHVYDDFYSMRLPQDFPTTLVCNLV